MMFGTAKLTAPFSARVGHTPRLNRLHRNHDAALEARAAVVRPQNSRIYFLRNGRGNTS